MKILCIALAVAFMLGLLTTVCFAQQDEGSKKVLKEGLMGAATGAIASSASGGEAGKGALIGAGVNVVGGALLDTITAPAHGTTRTVPVEQAEASSSLYQQGYQAGYQKGFQDGYDKGYAAGITAKK